MHMNMKKIMALACMALAIILAPGAQAVTNTWDITPGTVGSGNGTVTGSSAAPLAQSRWARGSLSAG
jgi:hypothetical protein